MGTSTVSGDGLQSKFASRSHLGSSRRILLLLSLQPSVPALRFFEDIRCAAVAGYAAHSARGLKSEEPICAQTFPTAMPKRSSPFVDIVPWPPKFFLRDSK